MRETPTVQFAAMADSDDVPVLRSAPGEVEVQATAASGEDPFHFSMVGVRSVALTVIGVAAAILMLQYAQDVLIPVVVAVLMSYVLGPAVDSMERAGLPRVVGSIVVIVLLCGGIGFGAYTLSDEALAIVDKVPLAAQRLAARVESQNRRGAPEGAIEKVQEAAKELEEAAEQATDPTGVKGAQRVQVVEPAFAAREYLWAGGIGVLSFLGQFAMVLFLVFFLLVTGDLFKRKLVKIAGPTLTKKKISVQIMDDINRQISGFLRVQVITSLLVGVATAAALWWFGVEQYLVWGLLAGIFNSIPYLGPIVVTGGLAIVTFMQFDDVARTVYVSATALAITSLEGWLLTPVLMSRAAQMNPVAIFIGLLFWSWVWGVMGTILAVPMLMMLKAIADRVEDLQPVGELLGE
jgi:predicted PurR-regulated permease PerM